MVTKALRGAALLTTTVWIGGCATEGLGGTPPTYMDGYYDGCDIGAAMLIPGVPLPVKDETRYAADPAYRDGWEFGYRECYFEIDSILGN